VLNSSNSPCGRGWSMNLSSATASKLADILEQLELPNPNTIKQLESSPSVEEIQANEGCGEDDTRRTVTTKTSYIQDENQDVEVRISKNIKPLRKN
jgi:hypothetical protein